MGEVVNGNPLDKNGARKGHPKVTKFEWVKDLFGTYRFGEIGSCLVFNGKAGDKRVRIVQGTDVESYTLKAPLMTPITMNKTYFQVPRQAILPRTWEKIFTNPSIGDDINAAEYGTSLSKGYLNNKIAISWNYCSPQKLVNNLNAIIESQASAVTGIKSFIEWSLYTLSEAELFLSNGSLVNAQSAHLARLFKSGYGSFDRYEQFVFNMIAEDIKIMAVRKTEAQTFNYIIVNLNSTTEVKRDNIVWTLKQLLEEYRDGETYKVDFIETATGIPEEEEAQAIITKWIDTLTNFNTNYGGSVIQYNKPFDIGFAWAYQLACAEFFTNDKVDYIYNAELFRQYIGNLYIKYIMEYAGEPGQLPKYTINGIVYEVDYLSAKIAQGMINGNLVHWGGNEFIVDEPDKYIRAYWFGMLKYNRSLKYKDYFTGARTRPIAIGNTEVNVNDDIVQVVDIASGIQKQRFLNVVNKIPRDLKGYTKGIFGVDVAPDWHNPLYLARVSSTIYGQEVENTGDAQMNQANSRTSVLKNAGGTVSLEFKLDRNSIIIGVVDFDIPRAYSKGVNRMYMEVDRYDMNNPYLQYTGDQEVYGEEYDARKNETFAYQGAYMHEKQDYSEAFGGFIEYLPGYTFLDQYVEKGNGDVIGDHVSPDFIRSKPSELDRFYMVLSGETLANYFHFYMKHTTKVSAVRPLAYNPQILG